MRILQYLEVYVFSVYILWTRVSDFHELEYSISPVLWGVERIFT